MKKKLLYLCCGVIAFSALLTVNSCRKENRVILSENHLVPICEGTKTANQYVMICLMGHDGSKCPGCITLNGKRMHIDCQGEGHACLKSTRVALQYDADSMLNASTLDTFGLTTDDFFNMPDRSLDYTDANNNRIYLNIPAQLVLRDTATQQFTFTGLFFTTVPEYTND